jgi:hypothetical protein
MTAKRLTLTQTRIANGVWEGVLTGTANPPALEALYHGRKLDGLTVTPIPGQSGSQAVHLAIPATVLNEGMQTVVLLVGGEVLASFTLAAGVTQEQDLRAEISLLRAELDLLKKTFRRHISQLQT